MLWCSRLPQHQGKSDQTDKKPEIHKKYVDIQFLAAGRERIGYAVDTGKYPVVSQKEENDIYFYGAIENENFVLVRPGDYSIFSLIRLRGHSLSRVYGGWSGNYP